MNVEDRVSVLFDRYVGALSITIGQRQITVDSLPENTEFVLSGEAETDMRPLWLHEDELSFLVKMIRYVLEKVKISSEAALALNEVLPRAEALLAEWDRTA